jgi:hypothetical protein
VDVDGNKMRLDALGADRIAKKRGLISFDLGELSEF